jgi:DNA-binding transcriptional MerR regulator
MSQIPSIRPVRLIGIAELSELAGVTPRALRYYEAEGLIRARRDRYNVRCYDWANRTRLLLLVQLRRAGLPLAATRPILDAQDAGKPVGQQARTLIVERLAALERDRESAREVLAMIDRDDGPVAARA